MDAPGTDPRRLPSWAGGALVSALGVALCAGYVLHLLSEPPIPVGALLYGTVAPSVVALGITAAGVWVTTRETGGHRIAAWAFLGAVTFACFGLLIVNYQWLSGGSLVHVDHVLLNTATGGAGAGFVVGLYDDRVRRATRRVAAREAELERERDRFRALFDDLPNPAIRFRIVDGDPVIEEINGAFETTFGYDDERAVGERVRDVLVPADRMDEPAAIAAKLESDGTVHENVRRLTADGVRDFLLIAIPIRVVDGSMTGHAVFIDVTQRERHVQRLEVLNRVLRHDLRNDASVIRGYAETIAETDGETAAHADVIRERATQMVERGDRARRIAAMLDGEHAHERVELRAVLREQVATLRNDHPDADVSLSVEVDCPVRGGPLLSEALRQLLVNAVEHNPGPEPMVSVRAETPRRGFVTITVADDGPGVPEREREVLAKGRETALEHSMGMGLWLARWAVEEAGGSIDIRDREPQGTTVVLQVPVAE